MVDESLDSSSAKCVYEVERERRVEALRVTCGSEVRSQDPASSSAEERDAKDEEVAVGGKIRSLMLLWRQRGVGMDSCEP